MPSTTRAGSPATVFASFLHFDLCFTIWVILGSLAIFITKDLHLTSAQQGLMVAIPTLGGSLARFPMGLLGDRYSTRRVGIFMLIFLFIPLLLGWLLPLNFPAILAIGLMLGVAGASFAVALPLASRWYPPERQGLVMGIAAAGNIGTVTANLFAPTLARIFGWHGVLGLTMIPLAFVLLIFVLLAKESPNRPSTSVAHYMKAMKAGDLWWFCLFYSVTFGGFVGLGSFLPTFLHNQYGQDAVNAGFLTAAASFMGSTLRPLGGYLSDKFGGVRMLTLILTGIVLLYGVVSLLLPLGTAAVFIIILISFLGMGNGSIFKLVPVRFPAEVGIATGLVGAFGGLGGFLLPILLGFARQWSGSYMYGLVGLSLFALLALVALRILVALRHGWRLSWVMAPQGEAA